MAVAVPNSCLIAEMVRGLSGKPLKLEAEVESLVGFYKNAYGFGVTDTFGSKPVMTLKDTSSLISKYPQHKAWDYAGQLPDFPAG